MINWVVQPSSCTFRLYHPTCHSLGFWVKYLHKKTWPGKVLAKFHVWLQVSICFMWRTMPALICVNCTCERYWLFGNTPHALVAWLFGWMVLCIYILTNDEQSLLCRAQNLGWEFPWYRTNYTPQTVHPSPNSQLLLLLDRKEYPIPSWFCMQEHNGVNMPIVLRKTKKSRLHVTYQTGRRWRHRRVSGLPAPASRRSCPSSAADPTRQTCVGRQRTDLERQLFSLHRGIITKLTWAVVHCDTLFSLSTRAVGVVSFFCARSGQLPKAAWGRRADGRVGGYTGPPPPSGWVLR